MSSRLTSVGFGFSCALISALLFSLRPVLVKLAYAEGVDPSSLMLLRMLFSAPIYALLLGFFLLRLRRRGERSGLQPKLLLMIAVTGLLGYYAASFLDLLGLQYVTAQLGRMILYVYPTLVVLATALLLRRRPPTRTLLGLLFAYIGVAVIFGHDLQEFGDDTWRGGLYIVLCAICFAAYLVFSKPLIARVGSGLYTSVAMLFACLAIALHYSLRQYQLGMPLLGSGAEIFSFNAAVYQLCLAIALFSTVIPSFLTALAINAIGAGRTSIASMIGPAFTSLIAVSFLGERFTLYHLAGLLLIAAGIAALDRQSEPAADERSSR